MEDVSFKELAQALVIPDHIPAGPNLSIAERPEPFVPPVFVKNCDKRLQDAEVLLVRASAAVGKSTLTRALSAERRLPVLDLARVPVATGSLIGLLSELRGDEPALEAFHAGKIPVLVDALDEGRLHSGDNGLLSFIETSAQLILQDRRCKRPKLVMLGRREAIAYAELYLADQGVEFCRLDVGFFDEEGARALVHAYARSSAKPGSLYLVHQLPAETLISTYFSKIANALEIPEDKLWQEQAGRSFAGYAPVLAAIGSLIPEIDNFQEAQNRLEEVGSTSAWGVIESVLQSIIARDQGKVVEQLVNAGVQGDTANLYSPIEQAALLMQYVQGLPLAGTGQIKLAPGDTTKYVDQVHRFIGEHPFLRDGKFSNDVIASYVLATAITNVWPIKDEQLLRQMARQPFLWRSVKSALKSDTIAEGKYLGFILSSFWSDPLTKDERVLVRDIDGDGGTFVEIVVRDDAVTFTATTPLHFYGQVRNVSIETTEPLSLVGVGDGASRVFTFDGNNRLVGSRIDLHATELRFRSGSTWLDAEVLPTAGQLSLVILKDVEYGWSDSLSRTYPFSNYPRTLTPESDAVDDELVALLGDCAARASAGTPLPMFPDYTVADNDYLQGVFAKHGKNFSTMIAVLVEEGFAQTSPIQAAGPSKIRVRLKTPFYDLLSAARGKSEDDALNKLMVKIRAQLP